VSSFIQNTEAVGQSEEIDKLLPQFAVTFQKSFSPLLQPLEPQVSQVLQITSVGSKLLRLRGVKVAVSQTKAPLYILSLDYPQQLSHFVDDYERCIYWQPQDSVNIATLRLIGWWQGTYSPRKLRHHLLTYSDSTPSLSCPTAELMKLN
jgi:hypothetical protein